MHELRYGALARPRYDTRPWYTSASHACASSLRSLSASNSSLQRRSLSFINGTPVLFSVLRGYRNYILLASSFYSQSSICAAEGWRSRPWSQDGSLTDGKNLPGALEQRNNMRWHWDSFICKFKGRSVAATGDERKFNSKRWWMDGYRWMENSVEELLEIEVEEREFLRNSTKLYLDKVITEDGTKKRDLVDKLSSV